MPKPFDIILITSPDYPTSLAVRELIVTTCGGQFPSNYLDTIDADECVLHSECGTVYISTCDPFGARLGSGGGTIAALSEAYALHHQNNPENKNNPTILICHAGGESTRCPTQITLGKAWTSLPVLNKQEPNEYGAIYSTKVSNPTALLIERLNALFENVPRGTVVVAASDVLLQFDANGEKRRIDFTSQVNGNSGVIGLAVPAPLSTAANHGVFVIDSGCSNSDGYDIHPTYTVLQKPTVDEMKEMKSPSCAFQPSGDDGAESGELQAWIDTGVITFLPDAAAVLKEMSTSTLIACTRNGLQELYNNRADKAISIEAFAKQVAPKICLYSDILHSLQTTAARVKRHRADGLMNTIHNKLSKLELFTCAISSGAFVHLGTTRELIDFLSLGAFHADEVGKSKIASFGRLIGLTSRALASLNCFDRDNAQSAVVLNSSINGNSASKNKIGRGSVLEHCLIKVNSSFSVEIGDRCLVSGLRPSIKYSLCVPSGICLQLLPLKPSSFHTLQSTNSFLCLCFGVDDDIKASMPKTLFGIDFDTVLSSSCLTESDLWGAADKKVIWNAKIMPVLEKDVSGQLDLSFLEWINHLVKRSKDSNKTVLGSCASIPGFQKWKQSKRISLSELRDNVDSTAELLHRKAITNDNLSCEDLLFSITKRKHVPCNLNHIIDIVSNTCHARDIDPFQLSEVREALVELESVILTSSQAKNFDVVGRCFMTMAILLSDVHDCVIRLEANEAAQEEEDTMLASLAGPFCSSSTSAARIIDVKNGRIGPYALDINSIPRCSSFLEKAATAMAGLCVRGNSSYHLESTATAIGIATTVIASAPARIDLHGGWSDTPPISYEHGGAVACLAVAVDGQRPLRAKCRLVKGMKGILLRTESRALPSNELIACAEVRISHLRDLKDYNNPQSECSLLKCALVYLRLVTADEICTDPSNSIQPYLDKFCRGNKLDASAGLEVVSTSLLPTGSGMGGSSILGGCVLAAIARCVGITLQDDSLVHAVLMLENMMTTGGGWQDQIGGLFGGLKLGTSDADVVLKTKVHGVGLEQSICEALSERLVLVFTGKPRLAKNILQNVLRRWARRRGDIVDTVDKLVQGAHEAVECLAKGKLDQLGSCISSYWEQKKIMAGAESGVEPDFVSSLLSLLHSHDCIVGGTLCGAGGGGFLALLLTKGKTMSDLKLLVDKQGVKEYNSLSWHKCTVDQVGLSVELVEDKT